MERIAGPSQGANVLIGVLPGGTERKGGRVKRHFWFDDGPSFRHIANRLRPPNQATSFFPSLELVSQTTAARDTAGKAKKVGRVAVTVEIG